MFFVYVVQSPAPMFGWLLFVENGEGGEATDITHMGQRTDIHVTAVPKSGESNPENIIVIIEVKGCWNAEIPTAVKKQLVGDYLRPNGLAHGIFLVGWFVCEKWNNSLKKFTTEVFVDGEKELKQFAAPYDGKTNLEKVLTILLDCIYPK